MSSSLKKILIIDDFEVNTYAIGMALKMAGFEIFKATSGKEVLETYSEANFDIVITDYKMPEMNGLQLIDELKKLPNFKYTPMIILSSENDEEVKRKARGKGVVAWINKPFKIEQFVSIVKKALQQ